MQSESTDSGPSSPLAGSSRTSETISGEAAALTGADGSPNAGATPVAPTWLAGGLAAAGLALLIFTLLRAMRRRSAQRRQVGEPGERIASIRAGAGQRDQLTNLMVDVEELTRRFAAQLDNKAARLEILLAEADETIRRLEAAGTGGRRGHGSDGAGADGRGRNGPRPGDPDDVADPITRDVYRLADEGCSAIEIARHLEQHTGKVELILALRNV